jgi:NADPH-dependent ferric siderophore reductase
MMDNFRRQATRQVAASGGRPVVWIFAEQEAALFARELFDKTKGLEGITVGYIPWIRSGR